MDFILTAILGLIVMVAILIAQKILSSTGIIASNNIEVYAEPACTTKVTSLAWGIIFPATTYTKTIYVKNEGNVPVTLALVFSNYSPAEASTALQLSSDNDGIPIAASAVKKIVISLLAPVKPGFSSFTFDTVINGSSTP